MVNADLVIGLPDGLRKNGPGGCFLLTSTKFRIASTGQTLDSVLPTIMSAPFPSWSHFDILRCIVGCVQSSIETSPQERWMAGLNSPPEVSRSSPNWKKTKNATAAIAQVTIFSGVG